VREPGIQGFPHMLVGYMRVSSSADDRQSVDLQRDALIAAGVDERHLHHDRASGTRDDRPGLRACLGDLRQGDVLVVWKLDRLGRSLAHCSPSSPACASVASPSAA
jgi:DNA invertase Pin-like site-specific DNA recombinase